MRRHPALIILFFICIKIALGDDEYDRIRAQVFAGAVASDHPILVMMGGGTASGKSSAVKPLQALGFIPVNATHIDPDDVMGMLSGYQAAVRAGDKCAANNFHSMSSKYAKQLFDEALSLSFQVIYDGTMQTAETAIALVTQARAHGYKVVMAGVFCPAAEAASRSWRRAAETGRYVPLGVIYCLSPADWEGFISHSHVHVASHRGYAASFMRYAALINDSFLFDTTGTGIQALRTVFRSAAAQDTYEVNWTSLDNFITLGFNLTMPALHAALTRELLANYDALDAACGIAPAPPVASPSFDSPLALWVWGILIAVCAVACGAAGFATGCGIHAYSVRRRQRMRLGRAGNELEALEEAAAGASGTGLEHALLAGEEKGMP